MVPINDHQLSRKKMKRRWFTSMLVVLGRFIIKTIVLVFVSTWLVALMLGSIPNVSPDAPLKPIEQLDTRIAAANAEYFIWVDGLLHLDLGYSTYYQGDRVSKFLVSNFLITLALTCGALLFNCVFGMLLGIAVATKEEWRIQDSKDGWGRTLGRSVRIFLYSFNAIPTYVVSILLLLFSSGMSSWVMAAISMILGSGILMDFVQMSNFVMRSEYSKPYVIHALALGYRTGGTVPSHDRVSWHALRSALARLIPSIGSKIPFILGNVLVVEIVLEIPGLSEPLLGGVLEKDLPRVLAVLLLTTLLVQMVTLVMELLDFLIHPSKKPLL